MSPPIVCYALASRAHPVAAVRRTSEAAQRTARDGTNGAGRNEPLVAWNALLRLRCLLGWVLVPQLRTKTSSYGHDWCAMP